MPQEYTVSGENEGVFANPKTKEVLQNLAKEYGFKNAELSAASGSDKGDNFIGIITKVKVEGAVDGRHETLELILKIAPTANDVRASVPTRSMFLREMFAYTDVLPAFQKLQDELLLEDEEKFRFVKCYTVNKDDLNEFLVMEDMMLQNYQMHKPRLETLDRQHVEVALSALAKFHSFSYVMQDRHPKLFNKMTAAIPEEFLKVTDKNTSFQKYFEKASVKALNAIDDIQMYNKFESFTKNTLQRLAELVVPNKYSVICHGDYWKNNILFKYENGRPVEACPLDYQVIRHSSPITDIMYIIFCCTTQEMRTQHYESLLLFYHQELAKQLQNFSLDINHIFPKEEFLAEVKRVGSFGLGMAICVLLFFTCSSDDIPDTSDAIDGKVDIKEDSESYIMYKERISTIVEDSIRLGYI